MEPVLNSKAMHALYTIPCGLPEKTASSPSTPSLPNTVSKELTSLSAELHHHQQYHHHCQWDRVHSGCSELETSPLMLVHCSSVYCGITQTRRTQENLTHREQLIEGNGSQSVVPRPIASAPSGNLSEVHIRGLHPSSTESETLG